ncbi:MAG: hypothetical protein ABS45_06185 [Comamonas sp. SCN 65-56]|nr:MAG: hypothetical protein ABS45_06185 [Comamonas sp. SCN 65-56]
MPLASFSLRVFCLALLCGSGQVVFMENALSGALNLLAFAWAAWATGAGWTVLIGAVLGLLVATAFAWAVARPGSMASTACWWVRRLRCLYSHHR